MKRVDEDDFRSYVVARMDHLRRVAYLLCHDWHTADDLVSVTIEKLYLKWSRAQGVANLDAYTRKILYRSWIDERRRPWRREHVTSEVPESAESEQLEFLDRMALRELLGHLTPRRRAAVVMRFYQDLSIEETADILGCSVGTVKSLTSRALDSMRQRSTTSDLSGENV